MLLYGNDPLEVVSPNMTDYITAQDAKVLLNLLAAGPVSVATDTHIPVRPWTTSPRLMFGAVVNLQSGLVLNECLPLDR